MDWEGWLILILILWSVWTFVPRHFRAALRTGLGPAVDALSESMRAGVRLGVGAIQYAAYRWLLGVEVPGDKPRNVNYITPDNVSSEGDKLPHTDIISPSYQIGEPDMVAENTDTENDSVSSAPTSLHKLNRVELITLLAMQKDDKGGDMYSANKIADFVGGDRNKTMALIAEVRPKKITPPKEHLPQPRPAFRRPKNGW